MTALDDRLKAARDSRKALTRIDGEITLHVTIFDPQSIYRAAVDVALEQGLAQSDDEVLEQINGVSEMLGTPEEPNLDNCLRMIFDPGESPQGLTIEDSSAETGSDANAEAA